MIDGVLGNEIGQANRLAQEINLDSIAEIKILLNTYRAEYGRTGGGQVQIISKSGGSQYAGNLYYYGRHEKLNANNFFNNRANRAAPRYRFNTYGANLGGPVPATRSSSSSTRWRRPMSDEPGLCVWTMPTDAERRGDFSQTLDQRRAHHQIRSRSAQHRRSPFPGQHHPRRPDQRNGLALLNLLPRATVFDRGVTLGNYNHQTQEIAENPRRNNIARVDWRPSANDSFYFTFKDWYSDQRGKGSHRRAGGVGLVSSPLPEHRSRRQRELHEDHPVESDHRSGIWHSRADRAVPPVDARPSGTASAGRMPATRSGSSIPN